MSSIDSSSFIFPKLYNRRLEVLNTYVQFVNARNQEELKAFFGLKNESDVQWYLQNSIFNSLTCKAILRYKGIAYEYLDFISLNQKEQKWIEDNVIIFSNLFGPLLAKDKVPNYRYKQNSVMDGFKPELFYKKYFSENLDAFLEDELVIDLRAGFYEKFYTLKQEHISMKFLKDGKVVSHWAKAYRGKILRTLAIEQPKDRYDFEKIVFAGLQIEEIIQAKNRYQYVFSIKKSL